VATLRREPRRRAEQVNSVPMGGHIRVLRTATDADVTASSSSSRRAPNAENLAPDSPTDWVLAQTMEGYLGFARKADFDMTDYYRMPDGILKFPVVVEDMDTSVPAGTFVYNNLDGAWQLFNKKPLPADADVADVRPEFTAEQIEELMEPMMGTPYVWGGVTNEGIDCSGFSQFFMRASGVMIPRDAVQQANTGLIVAWGDDVMEKALPGDLIFFATDSGRINHVAVSLGGPRIIHSAGRGVHLFRLDEPRRADDEDLYGERVIFARRVAVR
jgi:cell wall-associated NlpC family hydrolase